jgi:uncharacterized damage-inducible protein DinB
MNDIADLLDGLRRGPNILTAFVRSIPSDQWDRRRAEGFWTVAEHVSHLAQVQPMLLERLQRFRDEDHPVFVPYIPGEDEAESATPEVMYAEDALAQFARCRAQQVDLLAELPVAAWSKTADHPEYRHYSAHILARHILMHDHWHMYRMEELWLTRDEFLTGAHP